METVGNFNKISEELKKQIPSIEKVAVFQLLNGVPNPESDPIEKAKMPMLFGKTQLLTQFRIKDPQTKSAVEVVLPEGWDYENKRPMKAKCFVAGAGENHFNGSFALIEGNMEHEELFEVLWLSPEREGSPFSDSNIPKRFKILDGKKDAKSTNNKIESLRAALKTASEMDEDSGREFAASMGNWNWQEDWETLHPKIKDYARQNVDIFLTRTAEKSLKSKATLKKALDCNVLSFDASTGAVSMGKNTITILNTGRDGFDLIADLQSWFDSADNGAQVMKGIDKELKAVKA